MALRIDEFVSLKGKVRGKDRVPRARKAEPWHEQLKRKTTIHESGCWVWTGQIAKETGYGKWRLPGVRESLAHRWVYLLMVGPIPPELEIDHLCRNRACCNPEHLEAVTRGVNCQRGICGDATGPKHGEKTHCRNGHPYSGDNLYVYPNGERGCRNCSRLAQKRYYERGKQNGATR